MKMIVVLCTFLAVAAASTLEKDYEDSALISPCPDVFMYVSPEPDSNRWYGIINVTTDNLDQLRLDILLDDKADILGSWSGQVTTLDNRNYTIIVSNVQNNSTPVVKVHFFVKYKPLTRAPRLEAIRLNGKEICSSLCDPGTKVRWPPVIRPPDSDYDEDDSDAGYFIDFTSGISRKKYPESDTQDPPSTPCPDVFTYEPSVLESGRWYGVINMTKKCNHSLQLDIMLDEKADILGNWVGEVSTLDNMNYTITADLQNSSIAVAEVRFFVKYNLMKKIPRLVAIRLDGKDICSEKIDPGTNITNRPTNDSAQESPKIPHSFIDTVLGILQEGSWGFPSLELDEKTVAPDAKVAKYSGTTTESSQSTFTPKPASERKKVDTEDQMSKPVVYIYPNASAAVKDVSTEVATVSSTTIRALSSLLAVMMAAPTSAMNPQVTSLVSPCPNVFNYDTAAVEPNKWNGVVTLTTEIPLYALWLNIVLDNKANILGNWVGEVTTDDNIDFKIENTKMTIKPGTLTVPFFIQYKAGDIPPKLVAIRFNGKEICQIETHQVTQSVDPVRAISYEEVRPEVTVKTTVEPTVTTTSRNYNKQQTTKAQYWYQRTTPAPTTTTAQPSQYWTEARTTERPLQTTRKTQYWQQTTPTLKPIYWTQATTEAKSGTTERTQDWSYRKDDNNQQVTSTVKPTNQTWSQSRSDPAPRITTVQSSGSKVQSWSGSQTQTKVKNRTENFQTESQVPNNQQTTPVNPLVWPNVPVVQETGNQNVSSSGTRLNNSQIEVKQIGKTKYWSKIPSENTSGSAVKVYSGTENTSYGWSENSQRVSNTGLQNEPYAKVSIKQAVPPQNYDQTTETPLYVRPADRQIISSTYDVDTRPQVHSGVGTENSQPVRPIASYQQTTEHRNLYTGDSRPVRPVENNDPKTSQSSWSGDGYDTWVEPARHRMSIQSGIDSSGYLVNDGRIKTLDGSSISSDRLATESPAPSVYKIEQYDSNSKQEEYYDGGVPVLYIPDHRQFKTEPTCGKVLLNKDRGINLKSTETLEGQWPWQIALYQQQTSVDFRYICGGTLVSKRHVITAAHCVTKKKSSKTVNKNTLTVYLGKHNLRNSVEGVQVKFVNRILLYPEYDAATFKKDLAILELRDTISYSDRVQPICLWPEEETDLRHIVGKTGSVVGWGYESNGMPRTELTLLQMAVVDQETCVGSYADFFRLYTSDRTYCAGYRNHGAACNGDSGGGMVFQKGDSWYLRGVVSLSVARQGTIGCDPSHYVIFTDVAKFRSWIHDNIEEYI